MSEEKCDEGDAGEQHGEGIFQRSARDPDQCGEQQRKAHRTEAPEHAEHLRCLAEPDVDEGE